MKKHAKSIVNYFIDLFNFSGKRSKRIAEFCHYNRDMLIIVADPKTDKLFMSYHDKIVANQIKSVEGYNTKVVKGVLTHSLFKKEIDNFLTSIMESMQLSLENGNQFYQWIDGALCNIARALRIERKNKEVIKATASVRVGFNEAHPPVA